MHRLLLVFVVIPLRLGLAGFKDLQFLMNQQTPAPSIGQCDFDRSYCDWSWNSTNGTFLVTRAPVPSIRAPTADANERSDGKFLHFTGHEGQLRSKIILRAPGSSNCYLELALYQVEMKRGTISLIIETYNRTSYVAAERQGNDYATWETTKFNLGGISQDFGIILEIRLPQENSSVSIDNIRLVDCYHDSRIFPGNCTANQFSCGGKGCLSRVHVCDLVQDCADGEDENWECDKVPEYARCNFENGWCGWANEKSRPLNWTLNQGPTPTERMGPIADHTYHNATGTYAYVDMSKKIDYGSQGTLNSPVFNPMPPYHADPASPYFNSCKVRFFYHQYGMHVAALGLYLVQMKAHQNHSTRIWWSYKDNSNAWNRQVVTLPAIRYKYYLQFEANRGYASKGDVAIDDVSLSPECFGIGVPRDVLKDWDYWNQKIMPWGVVPQKHTDFTNETIITISTCGQTGRFGPTPELCMEYHNETGSAEVLSDTSTDEGDAFLRSKGIQRWIVPRGNYYTIIATGARGGLGALSMGTTLGSMVRGVVELEKGQQLYFMVGQPGTNACPKSLGSKNNTCQQFSGNHSVDYVSIVRQVKNIELKDGGGGGGGATYIFTLKPNGQQQPLMVAGGGGGLGPTQFRDDGIQHAQGRLPPSRSPITGESHKKGAGGGGGWLASSDNETLTESSYGKALTASGIPGVGGIGCGPNHQDHGFGDGGFGGGGGGCLSGGGGGGYAGGDTGHIESGNGEGGFSFISPDMLFAEYEEKVNAGPGEIYIIPAVPSGCGCDFRCVALDQHLSLTQCLCPPDWHLGDDAKSCTLTHEYDATHRTFTIILIAVSIGLTIAFFALCFLLYNRFQNKKAARKRRQALFGPGTELTTLRLVPDTMLNEFNPNYEFPESLYNFKDLPQIARDNITLIKPIGQGAFGEVYQGIYRYNRDSETPVAIKTLPSTPSSAQAVADFMMEALIMSKFKHPNIVHFIGVSFDKHPRYIVLELLAGGDLKNFLREERPRPDRQTALSMQSLIMCAYDVANGCKYMEDARFIHRDIAARNCLLTCKGPGRVVKIADFGMARDIYRSDYYRKGGKAMLPIKWMPPESFLDGIFTTKTDVWAFGVLLWEIMSFGYMPYTGCHNREVMSMVTNGGRLEKPAGCPDPIYGIMTRCWHPRPDDRPSFTTIVERIGYCLQDPDVINHPTPNYDLLPICDREVTIMRPDPDTECINAQAEVYKYLDGCAYMQPRMGFRPSSYRVGPSIPLNVSYTSYSSNDRLNSSSKNIPVEQAENSSPREHFHKLNSPLEEHDLNDVCVNREYNRSPANNDVDEEDEEEEEEEEPNANVEQVDDEKLIAGDEAKSRLTAGHNGHESTTTTDTNSDSIFIPSTSTPPDTVSSSSSPNTRHCSPNHMACSDNGNGACNNANGIIRKNPLKAAISLDPTALYSNTKHCDKINFIPTSKHRNADLNQDSLVNHELSREECSC